MGCFRRARLALDVFRSYSSKIIPRANAVKESTSSRIYQNGSSFSSSNPAKLPSNSCLSQRIGLGFGMGASKVHYNPFVGVVAYRFYYANRYEVHHFRPRGPTRWFQNPYVVLIIVLVGSGAFITVYYGNLETVPYTKRRHFVLFSKSMERKIRENQFQQMKQAFKGKILPAIHPERIRVRLIAKEIIEALQRGLKNEKVWSDIGYVSLESDRANNDSTHQTLKALSEGEVRGETSWYKDDEVLEDKWVQQTRNKGQEKGSRAET